MLARPCLLPSGHYKELARPTAVQETFIEKSGSATLLALECNGHHACSSCSIAGFSLCQNLMQHGIPLQNSRQSPLRIQMGIDMHLVPAEITNTGNSSHSKHTIQ
jgi:hypothetical protein